MVAAMRLPRQDGQHDRDLQLNATSRRSGQSRQAIVAKIVRDAVGQIWEVQHLTPAFDPWSNRLRRTTRTCYHRRSTGFEEHGPGTPGMAVLTSPMPVAVLSLRTTIPQCVPRARAAGLGRARLRLRGAGP